MLKKIAYIAFLVFLLYLLPSSWSTAMRDAGLRMVRPAALPLVRGNASLVNFFHSIRQIPSLRSDKEQLQKEIGDLEQQVADRDSLKQENQALRQELGVTGVTRSYKKVLAHVILSGGDQADSALDKTLTVDTGSRQGIKEGEPVVSQGLLVGRVISVTENSAVIRLIISAEFHAQAWLSANREKGLLSGDGNTIHLEDITQGIKVNPGDLVETSGLGGNLPQGILIGSIDAKESKESDLSQRFSVKLTQDPLSLETVFILLTST